MYKIKSIVIVFILLGELVFSQQVYFSNRYDLSNLSYDGAKSILVDTNQIVAACFWTDLTTYKLDLCFFDLQGTLLNKKTISAPNVSYYAGISGSLNKTYDGGFILAGTYEMGNSIDALLYRFNSIGDTLWTKRIGDSAEFQSGWQAKQTADSGFILCGQTTTYDPNGDFLLVKTDSLGNVQWEKHFGSGLYDLAQSVVQTADGGYFVGGTFTNQLLSGNGKYYKTDSLGNVQWTAFYGNPVQPDNFPTGIQTKDGGYLLGGNYTDSSYFQGDYRFGRLSLVKLNPNGSLLWDKKYLQTTFNLSILSIRELADSSIIAVGTTSDTILNWPAGFILKTNQYGDSLWYRTYELLTFNNSSENYLEDIYPMPDGGFVACGWVVPKPPDVGTQDAWVMRVDSLGCSYPLCDPTFGISPLSFGEGSGVRCYPNPFTNEVFIESNLKGELEIYNVHGKRVLTQKINGNTNLNLAALTQGLYLVTIKTKQGAVSAKIIK